MWLRRRIPSLILLFLVAWIIGSLIASGKAGLEIFPLNLWRLISIIQIFPYLLSATLITLTTACVILVVIGFKPFGFKSVKRKPKIPFSRQIWIYTVLGNSFFIILFLLALYVVQKKGVPKGVISGLSYQLPETPPPPSSTFPSLVLGYALAYMIMAMFAMGGVILIRVLKELREGQEVVSGMLLEHRRLRLFKKR